MSGGLLLVAAIAAALGWSWKCDDSMDPGQRDVPEVSLDAHDRSRDQWVDATTNRFEVRDPQGESKSSSPAGSSWDPSSEGPLDASELARVRNNLAIAVEGCRLRLDEMRRVMDTTDMGVSLDPGNSCGPQQGVPHGFPSA
jgi:hypothetical protein